MQRAGDLGERALVQRLTARLRPRANFLGLADDAAALPWGQDCLVATLDTLAAHTHVPAQATPRQVGHLAAAANLSDLAAKGAQPVGLLLGLGLPRAYPAADAEALVDGVQALAEAHGAEVLGGDTKPALELTVAIAALGRAPRERILARAGAQPGDVLAVTGTLGGAAAGLAALERGLPPASARRSLEPQPRVPEGLALAASGAARASIDLSDGLATSLHHLARANPGCAFALQPDALPLDPAALAAAAPGTEEATQWALQGGGDYELLVCLDAARVDEAAQAVRRAGGRLTPIGRVEQGEGVWLQQPRGRGALPDAGWEHFR
jgi:thiamine-monophosphate kinase